MTTDLFGDPIIEESNFTFKDFWDTYPSKRCAARPVSERRWNKLKPDEKAAVMADLGDRSERDEKWRPNREGKMYIPLSSTYLNQGRWMDKNEKRRPASEEVRRSVTERINDCSWADT